MNSIVRVSFVFILVCIFISCTRSGSGAGSALVSWSGAYPMAILQPGAQPIWFQLTEDGPVYIESIEDVMFTSAFIPWPYAPHISYIAEDNGVIVMVVNRDGFLRLAPNDSGTVNPGLALHRFSGGDYWSPYTVGGFVYFDDSLIALLYLDERFFVSGSPIPKYRTWSFNMNSNTPFPMEIPALQSFPFEENWDVDTLRLAGDGFFYYRAAKRSGYSPVVRMFRTADLASQGEEISIEAFFNSAPNKSEVFHPSLPPLPEGFYYTEIGRTGNVLFASWEEQEDFSIGAAGFLVVRP
ncbi:MAG: hypothetical protein FWD22_03895 [Treponema sp.]|nr:hypothetical protein [Treponema sp.]